jgi:hypothetical protein
MSAPVCQAKKYRYVFTAKEDQMLETAIEQIGTNNWDAIAEQIPGRSARQCKDRWFTYLSPEVNRTPWTSKEDSLLFDVVQTHGPKWGTIVQFFCNRTQNNIKNRWNTVVKKAKSIGSDPTDRSAFIEAGKKIASRSTRMTFERPREIPETSPQQIFSVGNLLN